jgi:hypothetical protein
MKLVVRKRRFRRFPAIPFSRDEADGVNNKQASRLLDGNQTQNRLSLGLNYVGVDVFAKSGLLPFSATRCHGKQRIEELAILNPVVVFWFVLTPRPCSDAPSVLSSFLQPAYFLTSERVVKFFNLLLFPRINSIARNRLGKFSPTATMGHLGLNGSGVIPQLFRSRITLSA